MYVGNSARRVMTYQRPQVEKRTASLPQSHHILEDILSNSRVRKVLRWMTRRDREGKCFFMRLCENYDNPAADFWTGLKWAVPNWAIDLGIWKAGLDREGMKEKLFHHPPTVKALALTARSIGQFGLTVPQRYAAPLFTVWNITQACNLTCKHCYQNAHRNPDPDELTTDEKLGLIDQMGDEFVPFVAFAGGEPLVTPDLWKVLERCEKRGLHVTLATNGTMLTPEICQRLKAANVKYIEVSLDSLNPEEHDEFRGQAGSWKRTVQGIRNSVAAGIRTGMAVCFTRQTAHTVDEVVRFAIDLGCKTFAHFNFIPVGRGKEIIDQDMTPGQREMLLRKLQQHLVEGKIGVVSTAPQFGRSCILYGSEDGVFATGHAGRGPGKKTMVLSRYIGGCGSGRCYCSIQPNGAITPCVYIPGEEIGNIRRQTLAEIWSDPMFATLQDRDDRGDHCGVCDYRAYCGGCRARALAYTGDIQAGDPGCIYNHHEWQELVEAPSDSAALHAEGWPETRLSPAATAVASHLVQIVGTGVASAAAKSGRLGAVSEAEVRELDDLAGRLKSLSPETH
jgi:radical SAM protein with 4Fe4S-binding SPASM domain